MKPQPVTRTMLTSQVMNDHCDVCGRKLRLKDLVVVREWPPSRYQIATHLGCVNDPDARPKEQAAS